MLSQLIGWTFFLIALSMFKEFISRGFSVAVGEFLLKSVPLDKAEKFTRWFAKDDAIIESLAEAQAGRHAETGGVSDEGGNLSNRKQKLGALLLFSRVRRGHGEERTL